MKRRFVLPAAFSFTLLAFLFFGFTKTTVIRVPPAPEVVITEYVFPKQAPEMPPEPDEMEKNSSRVPPPPSQDEPFDPVDRSKLSESSTPPRPRFPLTPFNDLPAIDPGIFRMGAESGEQGAWETRAIDAALLDHRPRARVQWPPAYPAAAKLAGINGEVIVEFLVDQAGRVLSPRVVRSSDPMFDEPTLRAVSKWSFEPGMKGSRPVSFRMIVPVRYRVGD